MMYSRGKSFLRSFGTYSIGVIGMRLIMFFMLPLYTYFIDAPEDYSYFDLSFSICLVLSPVLTLQMREVAMRFMLDNSSTDQSKVLTVIYLSIICFVLLTLVLSAVAHYLFDIPYLFYLTALLCILSIHDIVSQATRGLGHSGIYIQGNLLTTALIALFNIIFLVVLRQGIEGIFLSYIIAHCIGMLYNYFRIPQLLSLNCDGGLSPIISKALQYSIPLVAVYSITWLLSNSDRYIISYYHGLHASGLYAVAMRFSMIINAVAIIFYQAWQESAIRQSDAEDSHAFYQKMFNVFTVCIALLIIVCTFVLKVNYSWLVAPAYQDSLPLLFPLLVSMGLNALATAFFEPIYQSKLKTQNAIWSIAISAIVSICLNCLLVPMLGGCGAALIAITSNIILLSYRAVDCRQWVKTGINVKLIALILIISLSACVFYKVHSQLLNITYMILALAAVCWISRDTLRSLMSILVSSRRHKLEN